MNTPIVSIIVATYNRKHLIERCLQSLLTQTYSALDIIVVDDGSTDGTETLFGETHDSRIRYIRFEDNGGASRARNRGITEARGEYILVWDSDDVLYPHALERIISIFLEKPTYTVVSAPARILIGDIEAPFPKRESGDVTMGDILCKRIPSNEKVRIARAHTMKEVLYTSRNIDFLVNVGLIEKGTWYHLNEYLGDVHNNPAKGSLTALRRIKNKKAAIERAPYLEAFLSKHGEELQKECSDRYADYAYGAAIGFLLARDSKRARRLARESLLKLVPTHLGLFCLAYVPGGSRILNLFYR